MILRFTWYMSSDLGCNVWAVTVIIHDVCEGKEVGEGPGRQWGHFRGSVVTRRGLAAD